jgi:ankyrin repeat protein
MFASMRGYTELVDLLLQAGADVNVAPECGGGTALIYASINGYEEIVRLLLKAGADINAKFIGGMTVFGCAANHPGTLKILREYNQSE